MRTTCTVGPPEYYSSYYNRYQYKWWPVSTATVLQYVLLDLFMLMVVLARTTARTCTMNTSSTVHKMLNGTKNGCTYMYDAKYRTVQYNMNYDQHVPVPCSTTINSYPNCTAAQYGIGTVLMLYCVQ